MDVPVFAVQESGRTRDHGGRYLATVSIDTTDHPEIADLARVHAVEGVGDIATEAMRADHAFLLAIRMTEPVEAEFMLLFDLRTDRHVLEEAALDGTLVIAHTTPEQASVERPLWLAVDIDAHALLSQLGAP